VIWSEGAGWGGGSARGCLRRSTDSRCWSWQQNRESLRRRKGGASERAASFGQVKRVGFMVAAWRWAGR
jgi:hypothetical protein